MSLSSYEKRALKRFYLIYSLAVIAVVAGFFSLYVYIKLDALKHEFHHKLMINAFKIATNAIDAQMRQKEFKLPQDIDYILLDKDKNLIAGNFKIEKEIKSDFWIDGDSAYLFDSSSRGHLNIYYILLRKKGFIERKHKIITKGFAIAMLVLVFLLLIGWYLGKLFLLPMKEYVEKLNTFIKDTTHEINTPVTNLILATSKIEKDGIKPLYLNSIKISSKLIARIYEDLKFINFNDFSKTQKEDIDIATVIKESISYFDIIAKTKNIKIEQNIESKIVQANRLHLNILFKNLIENAIKYSPKSCTIKIVSTKDMFQIYNRGKIEPRKIDKIFNRYQRADDIQGGFGLGLDIVANICKKYNFKIDATLQDEYIKFTVKWK